MRDSLANHGSAPLGGLAHTVLTMLAIVALFLPTAVPVRAAGATCEAAQALLDAGLVADAQEAFARLGESESDCRNEGLAAVASRRGEATRLFVLAQGFEAAATHDANALDQAMSTYAQALRSDATHAEAAAALRRLAAPSPSAAPGGRDAFTNTRSLAAAGFRDEARKAALEVVKSGATLPPELRYLGERSALQTSVDRFGTVLDLVLIGAVGLIGVLLIRRLSRPAVHIAAVEQPADGD